MVAEKGSTDGYSIHLADSREEALAVRLYRFGGPNIEEYMKSKPDISRQEALRSLTPTFDDRGIQEVFYGDGDAGESIQFYAQAEDVYSFAPRSAPDHEKVQASILQTHGVLGSVEAVKEYTRKDDSAKEVSIELKNLSVHPKARRRGIGKALTEVVQEYACQEVSILEKQESRTCAGVVHLIVESDNEGAMALYKESGFVLNDSKIDEELCKLTWTTEEKAMVDS